MYLFLAIFFLLYSLLHVYVFLKARSAFAFTPMAAAPVVTALLFMVVSPILIRVAESHAHDYAARLLGFVGFTWMGLIFLFVCSALLLDLYRLILYMFGIVIRFDPTRFAPTAKACFYIPLVFALLAVGYGAWEAAHVRSQEVVVGTSKIPQQPGVFRIVQISDVHLGLLVREARLTRILRLVKEADPDLIVSTGDLVDGLMTSLKGLDELLRDVNARHGKFAVMGNHEFYTGIDHALAFTKKSGFTVLRNEAVPIAQGIVVAGVDDPAGPGYTKGETEDHTLLADLPRDRFILFLKHRPSVSPNSVGLFDLQLSGHTHHGQIFPFRLITRLFYRYVSGYFSLGQGSSLYVSRGSGTWGPPVRFLAPPEVTILTLVYTDNGRNSKMAK
jgi:uncharacterized protein